MAIIRHFSMHAGSSGPMATELIQMLDAILQTMPVDDFVQQAIFRSSVKGYPNLADQVHCEIQAVCANRALAQAVVALSGG